MFMYSFMGKDIEGKQFERFISFLFQNSTHFTLTFHNYGRKHDMNLSIYKEFSDYICKHIRTFQWFCYQTYEKPLNVMVFQSNMELLDIFLKYFDKLFHFEYNAIEDICFFSDKKLIFGSVSHEEIACLFLNSKNDIEIFSDFANWEEKNIIDEYISLP